MLSRHAQRISELETSIVQAVAELDRADGSRRVGLLEAIDTSRAILEEGYGDVLDQDVSEYLAESESDEDFEESDDDFEESDEDEAAKQ